MTVPLIVDGWGNALDVWSSPEWFRSFTGLGVGTALPVLLFSGNYFVLHGVESARPARVGTIFWPLLLGALAIWLLVHPRSLFVFRGLAVAAATGTVLFIANLALLLFAEGQPPSGANE
jgi:hypothetical protein